MTTALLVAAVLIAGVRGSNAATVAVPPGAGTLQAAIDAAADGDVLVGSGRYTGPVVINKRLTLVGDKHAAYPGFDIDAECAAPVGLTITADKVRTKHAIFVEGATTTGILIDGSHHSKFDVLSTNSTCEGASTGLWIHGGSHLSFGGGNVFYFTDTAIRLSDVAAKAGIKLFGFTGYISTTGLALENIAPGAGRKGAGIEARVIFGDLVQNGIVLTNADGVVVKLSGLYYTTTSVTVDAQSDNNLFVKNSMIGATDAGSGNCWKGNSGYPDSCP